MRRAEGRGWGDGGRGEPEGERQNLQDALWATAVETAAKKAAAVAKARILGVYARVWWEEKQSRGARRPPENLGWQNLQCLTSVGDALPNSAGSDL